MILLLDGVAYPRFINASAPRSRHSSARDRCVIRSHGRRGCQLRVGRKFPESRNICNSRDSSNRFGHHAHPEHERHHVRNHWSTQLRLARDCKYTIITKYSSGISCQMICLAFFSTNCRIAVGRRDCPRCIAEVVRINLRQHFFDQRIAVLAWFGLRVRDIRLWWKLISSLLFPATVDISFFRTVSKTARDIMEPRVENFLTMKTSLRDMKQFLQRWATTDNFRTYSIPIVDSPGM